MKRGELLRSKEYWLVQVQSDLFAIIESYMKKKKINRTELASKLKVTKGYISQILNGDFDHKMSKLVDLSLACGKVPIITFLDLEKYIKDDQEDKPHYLDNRRPIEYHTHLTLGTDKDAKRINLKPTVEKMLIGNFNQSSHQ